MGQQSFFPIVAPSPLDRLGVSPDIALTRQYLRVDNKGGQKEGEMIRYKCYDMYGTPQFQIDVEAETFEAVIIERDGNYYRPISHDLNTSPQVAKCVPVKVLNCMSGGDQNETVSNGSGSSIG